MKHLSSLLLISLLLQPVTVGRGYAMSDSSRPSTRELHLQGIENTLQELRSNPYLRPEFLKQLEAPLLKEKSDYEMMLTPSSSESMSSAPVMQGAEHAESSSSANANSVETISAGYDLTTMDMPAFPEDAQRPAIDWSKVDWEAEIITPEAEREFLLEREKLLELGKPEEAEDLEARRVPLYDDAALGFLRPPSHVLGAVKEFGTGLRRLEEQGRDKNALWHALTSLDEKRELRNALRSRIEGTDLQPHSSTSAAVIESDENVIDLGTLQEIDASKASRYRIVQDPASAGDALQVDSMQHESEDDRPINFIPHSIHDLLLSSPGERQSAFEQTVSLFVPVAMADEGSTLMSYYSGIEEEPIDFLLLSLTAEQNEDGSMGESNHYYHTFRIAETLSQMDKAYTDEYAAMIEYLQTTEPTNNRDKALKAILLHSMGQSATSIMDDLAGQFTTMSIDGVPRIVGIGLLPGHEPDVETMIAFAQASLVTGLRTDLLPFIFIWIDTRITSNGLQYNASGLSSFHLANTAAQSLIRFRGLTYAFSDQTAIIDQQIGLLLNFLRKTTPTDLVDILMTLRTFEMYGEDAGTIHALRDTAIASQSPDGSFGASLYESAAALSAIRESDFEITDVTPFAAQNHQPFNVLLNMRNTGQLPLWTLKLHIFAGKTFLGTHTVALETPLEQFEERSISLSLPSRFSETLLGSVPLTFYAEMPTETEENDNWMTTIVNFQPSSVQMNGALPPAYPLLSQAYLTYTNGQVRVDGRFLYRQDSRRSALRIVLRHVETGHVYSSVIPTSGLADGSYYSFNATLPTSELDEYQVQFVAETSGGIQYGEPSVSAWVQTYDIIGNVVFTVRRHSEILSSVLLHAIGVDITVDEEGNAAQDFARTGRHYTYVVDAQFEPFIYRYDISKDEQTIIEPVITRELLDTAAPQITSVRIVNGLSGSIGSFHAPGSHTIEITATDDVRVKDATIEYWNPNDNQWHPVAVTSFSTPTLAQFEWAVPDSLVGNGFKIRAKVTDTGSNQSGYLESVPFDLISSSVISVAELSDNAWGLGETKTVNFDFSSIPEVNMVDALYLNSDGYRITVSSSFTGTQKILTMPLNAFRLTPQAFLEARILSENFTKTTTVFSPHFAVVDRTSPPSSPWQAPTTFTDPSPGSLLSRTFEYIDERSDGGVDVIYTEVDGLLGVTATEWRRVVYRALRNGAWQPPVIIAEHQVFLQPDRNIYDQVIVKRDAGDGVHVLYHTTKDGDLTKTTIFSALIRNQRLIRHEELTSGTTETRNPALAVSPDGGVLMAVWQDRTGVGSSDLGNLILRKRTDAGWGSAEVLAAEGDDPALVTDSSTASLIFSDGTGIRYRYFNGSVWDQAQPVRHSTGQELPRIHKPQIFSNDDGTFDLFFKVLPSDNIDHLYHLAFDPVGSGQPVVTVEDHDLVDVTGGLAANEFAVHAPNPHEYHVVYTKNNGDGTGYTNGYLTVIHGQLQQGSHVFSLIRSVEKPLLDQSKTHLIVFAQVQQSGSDTVVQRNNASVLLTPNESPVFDGQTSFTISENRPAGHVVGTVHASDPENHAITYSIVGGDPNAQFAINPTTGQMTVAQPTINYESTTQFLLQVKAQDNGTPSASRTQTVTVTIANLNEAPFMYPAGPFTISENRPIGYIVGAVTSFDPENHTVTYSIVGGDPNAQFAINPTTGQITVAKATINYESTTQFNLTVRGADNAAPPLSRDLVVTINIADLNEAPNFLPPTAFTISENRPIGYIVGSLVTTDPENHTVMYSIVGGDPSAQFAINPTTGQITVAKATINYETTTQYLLQVKAQDNGNPSNSRTQVITVNIVNLNEAPNFNAPTTFAISENRPIGHIVGSVSTSDPEGQTVTYSIVGGDPNAQFAINATSGQITVAKANIDYETTTQYLLQVKAQDNGNPSNSRTQTITININNLNEAPSFLAPTSYTIAENRPVGFTVGDVNTYDPEGQTVTYSIVGGNDNGQFSINTTTGIITVANATIDYETAIQHLLQVKAQDNGNPSNSRTQTITVNVTNIQE